MPNSRKIIQLNPLNLNYKIFNSIIEASKQTKIDRNSIIATCNNNQHHAGGYYWKYLDEFINNNHIKCDINLQCDIFDFLVYNNLSNYISPCYIFNPNEIWKDVVGYEGLYKVSNCGNILCYRHYPYIYNLKLYVDRYNYIITELSKNNKVKYYKVHRLVAQSFIPNPNDLPCVNHKDEIKNNNFVDNLEWCTIEYNNNYGSGYEKRIRSRMRKYNG